MFRNLDFRNWASSISFSSNDLDAAVKYLEPLLISGAQNPDQAVRNISYLLRKVSEEGLEPALEKCKLIAMIFKYSDSTVVLWKSYYT